MKVQIYTGLGSQKHLVWEGDLEVLPRIGEEVVLDKDGDKSITVERIHHWLPFGKKIGWAEIYGR
jgi:hypothetical protein